MPNTIDLLTTTVLNTKISGAQNKIPNLEKYVTTPEFNKLTAENFTARLKQAILGTKTDKNLQALIERLLQIKQNI